jgi:hypothetical protein
LTSISLLKPPILTYKHKAIGGRRYLGLDILAKSHLTLIVNNDKEMTDQPALELSA